MSEREPLTLAGINQAFMRLAEVINRELTPEKILRVAVEGYNERMAQINRRPGDTASCDKRQD